jgi:AhpD family alkylhydroperoxidase
MNARIEFADFKQLAPAAADALSALSNSVVDSGHANLDKQLVELLKIRASQLNGCAFCVQYHLNLARKVNLSQTKTRPRRHLARSRNLQRKRESCARMDRSLDARSRPQVSPASGITTLAANSAKAN